MSILLRPCPGQKLGELRQAVQRLNKKMPQRAGARQLFIGELITVANELTT